MTAVYVLKNHELDVSVLDPVADQVRFGTRYCTGGYIFQITDPKRGDLLSGPTYPDSFNTFDGQGIPDAFNLGPLCDPASGDGKALIIGIGVCNLRTNQVTEFCRWEVTLTDAAIHMRTAQAFGAFALDLERTVTLSGRTVRSATTLRNTGQRHVAMRWFPHPFFPQPATDELCRFNLPVRFPDNPGYALAGSGFIRRRDGPWSTGYYQALDLAATAPLVILQRHPTLGLVAGSCSYAPTFLPIWGNPRTFSWEPFLECNVANGQTTSWSIDYDF
jgi:hypothetical protein